jgi:CHAT domain-containing protein
MAESALTPSEGSGSALVVDGIGNKYSREEAEKVAKALEALDFSVKRIETAECSVDPGGLAGDRRSGVLHVIGHGRLVWDDPEGSYIQLCKRGELKATVTLADLESGKHPWIALKRPGLVFLSSCSLASIGLPEAAAAQNDELSFASELLLRGARAVVGHTFRCPSPLASTLAEQFYKALVDRERGSVDSVEALIEAMKTFSGASNAKTISKGLNHYGLPLSLRG